MDEKEPHSGGKRKNFLQIVSRKAILREGTSLKIALRETICKKNCEQIVSRREIFRKVI